MPDSPPLRGSRQGACSFWSYSPLIIPAVNVIDETLSLVFCVAIGLHRRLSPLIMSQVMAAAAAAAAAHSSKNSGNALPPQQQQLTIPGIAGAFSLLLGNGNNLNPNSSTNAVGAASTSSSVLSFPQIRMPSSSSKLFFEDGTSPPQVVDVPSLRTMTKACCACGLSQYQSPVWGLTRLHVSGPSSRVPANAINSDR